MFGMFNLTYFEDHLISEVKKKMDLPLRNIFEDQLLYVDRVDRVLYEDDDRLDHGSTIFYRRRSGASKKNFPMLLPVMGQEVTFSKIFVDEQDAQIEVHFVASNGGFIGMEYYSPQRHFYPHGPYTIRLIELFLT